jgi:transglutaminase-like putative cysteine protease
MKIPSHKWHTLAPEQKLFIFKIIRTLNSINRINIVYKAIQTIIQSPSPIFIGFFTGVFSFFALFFLPTEPISIPVSFTFGLLMSLILRAFFPLRTNSLFIPRSS